MHTHIHTYMYVYTNTHTRSSLELSKLNSLDSYHDVQNVLQSMDYNF